MRVTLAAALVAALLLAPAALAADPTSPVKTREIVAFYADPGLRAGDAYMGDPVVEFIDGLNFVVVETATPELLRAKVVLDERVRYVTTDNPTAAFLDFVPNDARYNDAGHYGSKKIGAEAAWDRTLGSTAVKMQVLDSGILRTHEDFVGGRVLQGYDFVNNDNDPNDQGSMCSYHGSHVAGTSGATINNGVGIAGLSQHTILPTKAFYPYFIYCTSSTTALVNSLKYGGDQGAHVSSNSWGMSADDPAVTDALVYAAGKGTVHVAAAGNSGPCTDCVSWPWKARPDLSIVVAATDQNDAKADFSSQGAQVDVAAPGVGILSLSGSSTTAYQVMDGTSMAAPHVAGVAALLKALNPSWGFAQIEGQLRSTAVDLGAAGVDHQYGAGRVNADAATAGGGTPPPPATPPSAPQSLTAAHAGNAKSGKINLNWQAPASNGGAAITGYKIYRGTTSGGETLLTTVGAVLSFQDSGLTRGTTYYYKVSAMNSAGEGPLSNEASALG